MPIASSEHKYAQIAPSKIARVLGMIRGRRVSDGMALLRSVPNRGARFVEAVLKTASANAQDSGARNVDSMIITEAVANSGPMFKRIRAKSRGMAYVERHRASHIRISISNPS